MFDKLEHVERRFEELTARLSSPGLDPKDLPKFAKEQASLRELVETYGAYKKTKNDLQDNRDLLMTEKDDDMKSLIKAEIPSLETELENLSEQLKILLLPKDPRDEKNTILEIRAGTGGDEASLFAGELFRMYSRYAELQNWSIEILSMSDGEKGGVKEVVALITGNRVYSKLKFESGIHRVQRVPDTEANGRVHTSAVTVAILPEAEDVDIQIAEHELKIDVFRSGGAGGQSVNTTDSAVRITHIPTGTVVICQDERSQHKNKAKALKVLKSRLLDVKQREQEANEAHSRKSQIGSGDRSEKIRTYNFPQSRVTDHRINLTNRNLEQVMNGRLDDYIDALITHHQAELLKSETA